MFKQNKKEKSKKQMSQCGNQEKPSYNILLIKLSLMPQSALQVCLCVS